MVGRITISIRSDKKEIHCIRLTAGGTVTEDTIDVSISTVDFTTVKVFANSVILISNSRCLLVNIKDFNLNHD